MHKQPGSLVAIISHDFVTNDNLQWIITEDPPYKVIDLSEFPADLLDEVYDLYKSTYALIDKDLSVTNVEMFVNPRNAILFLILFIRISKK